MSQMTVLIVVLLAAQQCSGLNVRGPCVPHVTPVPSLPAPGPPPLVPAAPPALKPLKTLPYLTVAMLPTLGPSPTKLPLPPKPTAAPPAAIPRIVDVTPQPVSPPAGSVFVRGDAAPGHWEVHRRSCSEWVALPGKYLSGYTSVGRSCYNKLDAQTLCKNTAGCNGINKQFNECAGSQWTLRIGSVGKITRGADASNLESMKLDRACQDGKHGPHWSTLPVLKPGKA